MASHTAEHALPDPLALVPVERVQTLATIETPEDAQRAGQFLRMMRQSIRRIKAHYKEVRDPVREALRELQAQEKAKLEPFQLAEAAVEAPLIAWNAADKARVETERKALLDKARAEELVTRATAIEELNRAAASVKGTDRIIFKAQAKALAQAPLTPRINEPMPEPTKIDGVSIRELWHAEVSDLALLVQAVASGRAPLQALQPDQQWLDDQATALQAELSYPGVTAVPTPSLTARGL